MNISDVEQLYNGITEVICDLIKRNHRDDILNERFFHHMFSSAAYAYLHKSRVNAWRSLLFAPEYPTQEKFTMKYIDPKNMEKTKEYAIKKGK